LCIFGASFAGDGYYTQAATHNRFIPLVITRITSGLGNQLFQYALGRQLADKLNTPLYFDLSYYHQTYDTDTPRQFRLDQFNIDYQLLETSPWQTASRMTRLLPGRSFPGLCQFVQEDSFAFQPRVLKAGAMMVILDGFWQSEKYFAEATPLIRQELLFKHKSGPDAEMYRQELGQASMPISVHIRRGDYVTHSEFSQSFGFVGIDYYQRAISRLTRQFPERTLFVFSDDPDWVAENLPLEAPFVIVRHTGPNADLDDLRLMSRCQHHIIANSSFSWWGAWLNPNPRKLVIAPVNWFRHKPDWNTRDLLPQSWFQL
jgi:Glycosyl transferase family 11